MDQVLEDEMDVIEQEPDLNPETRGGTRRSPRVLLDEEQRGLVGADKGRPPGGPHGRDGNWSHGNPKQVEQ